MRLLLLSLPLLLSACATGPLPDAVGDGATEVNSICFVRQIDSWSAPDPSAFTFRHDGSEYTVSMIGQCPQLIDTTSPAYIVTRGSAASRCLNPGDTLRFGASDEQPAYCTVNRLYRQSKQ